MGLREDRSDQHDTKDARLIKRIREAGFNIDVETFSRFNDKGVVKFEETVVAVISRNTGSGTWRSYHEGWRVKCPHFDPVGYAQRYHREEPSNQRYWGGRNYKKSDSVIDKLVESKEQIPTDAQIRHGEALKAWRASYNKVQTAEADVARNFSKHDIDFIRYVVALLPDVDDLDVEYIRDDLVAVIRSLDKLDDRRAAMELCQEELNATREEV